MLLRQFSDLGGWQEQYRAELFVVEAGEQSVVARMMSAENGTYQQFFPLAGYSP